ncbi:hypothetical protein BJ166DRAFT_535638, partial [Pestalotiopsis sp. NC0098]
MASFRLELPFLFSVSFRVCQEARCVQCRKQSKHKFNKRRQSPRRSKAPSDGLGSRRCGTDRGRLTFCFRRRVV